MKKMTIMTMIAIALLAIVGFAPFASAQSPSRVTGGGTVAPGEVTQFGFSVIGSSGSFTCLMAGLFTAPEGTPFASCPGSDCVMIVKGKVTSLDSITDSTATFSGTAKIIQKGGSGGGNIMTGVPFSVDVTEGGAGVGKLQLHIMGMDIPMVPGEIVSGNIVIQP